MGVLRVFVNDNFISTVIFAYEIPEIFTDTKFLISKKLSNSALCPRFTFAISVIRRCKKNSNLFF